MPHHISTTTLGKCILDPSHSVSIYYSYLPYLLFTLLVILATNMRTGQPITPTFPPNAMMPNGGPMNGPGFPIDSNNHNPQQQYSMMMHGMNPQFPMMGDPSGNTPTSSTAQSNGMPHSLPPSNIGGPGSVPPDNHQSGSLSNLLNGGGGGDPGIDLKKSPASVQGHASSMTPIGPGSHHNNGPGSAVGGGPGSVHSQSGVNMNSQPHQSTPQSNTAQLTPMSGAELPDFQQQQPGGGNPEENDESKRDEILKIKASLLDEFKYSATNS
jgi:hypothetical protein